MEENIEKNIKILNEEETLIVALSGLEQFLDDKDVNSLVIELTDDDENKCDINIIETLEMHLTKYIESLKYLKFDDLNIGMAVHDKNRNINVLITKTFEDKFNQFIEYVWITETGAIKRECVAYGVGLFFHRGME